MSDLAIRLAAFFWLEKQVEFYQGTIPWHPLRKGFEYNGEAISLIGARGIWKPKRLELPISITTVFKGRYDDAQTEDGLLQYKYQGEDPHQWDNVLLREVWKQNVPIIYFHAVGKGVYHAFWPVFIQADDPSALTFTAAIDDLSLDLSADYNLKEFEVYGRRKYITSKQLVRLHQARFRHQVLRVYRRQCTLCSLKHPQLLDAAHIISDKEPDGQPIVQNGLSLCKIHHAAYDKNIIGITPDYTTEVRDDILHEIDGPMLKYGLQSLQGQKLILPRQAVHHPDKQRLDRRYQAFLQAG